MLSDLDPFDAALVARAQAGDAVALQALLTSVRAVVLRYSRSHLLTYAGGLEAAAMDVVCSRRVELLAVTMGHEGALLAQASGVSTVKVGSSIPSTAAWTVCTTDRVNAASITPDMWRP